MAQASPLYTSGLQLSNLSCFCACRPLPINNAHNIFDDPYLLGLGGNMAESVSKRRSARTRLPSLKAELNVNSTAKIAATPPSTRAKEDQSMIY